MCSIIIASGGSYDEGTPLAASHYQAGYLKRVLAPLGFTNVKIVLAGGTAAVSRGQSSLEGLTRAIGPSVIALLR